MPAAGLRRPRSLHEGHAQRQRLHGEVRARRRPGDPGAAARRVLPGGHQLRRRGQRHGHGLLADVRRRRRGSGRDLRHRHPARHGRRLPDRLPPRRRLRTRQAGVRQHLLGRVCPLPDRRARPASCWTVAAHRAPPTPSTATARRLCGNGVVDDEREVRRRHPAAVAGRLPDELRGRRPLHHRLLLEHRLPAGVPALPDHNPGLRRWLLPAGKQPDAGHRLPGRVRQRHPRTRRDLRPARRRARRAARRRRRSVAAGSAACASELVGDEDDCSARCVVREISACGPADQCCPAGCTSDRRRRLLAVVRRRLHPVHGRRGVRHRRPARSIPAAARRRARIPTRAPRIA